MSPPSDPSVSELQISVDATRQEVAAVNSKVDVLDQRLDSISNSLQTLIEQIGRLSEIITFNATQQEQRSIAIDAKLEQITSKLDQLADISRIQANTAASLVQVVNRLLERN